MSGTDSQLGIANVAGGLVDPVILTHKALCLGQEQAALRCQADAAAGPDEQLKSQPPLQLPDLGRKRRLGNVERLCRTPE